MDSCEPPALAHHFSKPKKRVNRTKPVRQKKAPKPKFRGFCFTVNNYDDEDEAILKTFFEEDDNCEYLIYGYEIAPRTKTPHLQGFIYFKNTRSMVSLNKQFTPWHIEASKAKKPQKAYVYCMKGGKYIEYGEPPRQGKRSDLEEIRLRIEQDKDIGRIQKQFFPQWIQYSRQFDRYQQDQAKKSTKLIIYDDEDIVKQFQEIYKNYNKPHIFPKWCEVYEVLQAYHSGKYDYVFINNKMPFIEILSPMADETLF